MVNYYRDVVATELGRGESDIVCLGMQPDEEDEFDYLSFFPKDEVVEASLTQIQHSYETEDFLVGDVYRLVVNGVTFVAEHSSNAWIIYANKHLIR